MEFFGVTHFGTFVLSGILLNLTPGIDTMYILGRSISQGVRAGIISALGISTGSLVHTLAAATGLSLVLATSATAFAVVKYCGAAYLIFMGVRMVQNAPAGALATNQLAGRVSYRRLFFAGMLTNVLNPKVAVFFLAFLPQFIAPSSPHPFGSFMLLGATFICSGTCWCLVLAVYAARLSGMMKNNQSKAAKVISRLSGLLFIGIGLRLAIMKR